MDPKQISDSERETLTALGFTMAAESDEAELTDKCKITVTGHGGFHFLISVLLPSGASLTGFCPRAAVMPPWSGEQHPEDGPPEVRTIMRVRSPA